jgi:hypothetical protein
VGKPASCAEAALHELCVRYGYCLHEDVIERLLSEPPDDPDQLTDAVIVGEGLDPILIDKRAREELRQVVVDWLFDDGAGGGSKSGLPRLAQPT